MYEIRINLLITDIFIEHNTAENIYSANCKKEGFLYDLKWKI